MNKITKNKDRLINTENRLTAIRGERCRGLGEKGEKTNQTNKQTKLRDNSMVIARGKGRGRRG